MIAQLTKLSGVCSLLFFIGCQSNTTNKAASTAKHDSFVIFSPEVKDSFSIQTQLPVDYKDNTTKRYPVVVLLDANFHFPMLAASVRQYEKAGLLPPLILVGVGYRSLNDMDSLRTRDYLYPAALPSDELTTTGGGKQFRHFIISTLLPTIDSTFRTTKQNRSLLGHSFGGYFTLYSLLAQTTARTGAFKNFIAASPSLWYHDFYLNQLLAKLASPGRIDSTRIFISVGGAEDSVWSIKPVNDLTKKLKANNVLVVKGGVYNQLEHMDTGQLSFLKGLQAFYR
ncbi:alpha/beta hydrolase [Fibrella forsythiae]|uniref:Alpha/beta hydrolase n=1 Tax=Fibrella forsythiae TaxID=2817061 RepID=A0ABS3JE03_9BACT|nr:alpha/beta hydrolase-fold protein [Fibrella forsythiae]MBO0948230.1 alpha/beta hydrolase [Fibrella forsythiae]